MNGEITFHLEDFDGPLELLLALVSKHKMDLHNIPILTLIDQYTQTVDAARQAGPEVASTFIEMAARLVEMKSFLLLPRSEEGERMKEELTGQLVEYDQCRRLAENLRQRAEQTALFVRQPLVLEWDDTYALHHPAQMLVDSWQALTGRAVVRPAQLTPQQFEPVVAAPQVSVVSRVVHILRRLVGGGAARLGQLFTPRQSRSANIATFLALLELVRGGRVQLDDGGAVTLRRGRLAKPEKGRENEPD